MKIAWSKNISYIIIPKFHGNRFTVKKNPSNIARMTALHASQVIIKMRVKMLLLKDNVHAAEFGAWLCFHLKQDKIYINIK